MGAHCRNIPGLDYLPMKLEAYRKRSGLRCSSAQPLSNPEQRSASSTYRCMMSIAFAHTQLML